MLNFLHAIAINLYVAVIHIAALFNKRARAFIAERKKFKLHAPLFDQKTKVVLFHCASLGEFEQAEPFISRWKQTFPEWKLVISFYSPSGFNHVYQKYPADAVLYLPFDTRKRMVKFIHYINPNVVCIVKNEFWPSFLQALQKKNIPVYSIYTWFSDPNKYFSGPFTSFYRNMFLAFTHFYPASINSEQALSANGFSNVKLVGDGRIEKGLQVRNQVFNAPVLAAFSKDHKVMCLGSSYQKEEQLIFTYLNKYPGRIKIIIAPHQIDQERLDQIKDLYGDQSILHSQATRENVKTKNLLIIDSIGILKFVYRYAELAFIGGGFGHGLHNYMEALVYKIPIFIGPNYQKSDHHIQSLIEKGIISPIPDFSTFEKEMDNILTKNPRNLANQIAHYLSQQVMGSESLLKHIKDQGSV